MGEEANSGATIETGSMKSGNLTRPQVDELWECVRFAMAMETDTTTTAPTPAHFSRGEFAQAVGRHRIDLSLNPVIDELGVNSYDAEIIKSRARRQQFSAMTLARETAEVVAILRRAQVRVLVMKGVALALQTTGSISSRGVGDIDIWVSPDDLERTITELEANGFSRRPGFAPQRFSSPAFRYSKWLLAEMPLSREYTAVDLHWWPLHVRNLMPSFEVAWARRVTFDIAGTQVDTLSAPDALTHSCSHAQQDGWFWLRSLVDIDRLARTCPADSTIGGAGAIAPSASVTLAVTQSAYLRRLANRNAGRGRLFVDEARDNQRLAVRPDATRWRPSLTWSEMRPRLRQSRHPVNLARVTALSAIPPRIFLGVDGVSEVSVRKALLARVGRIGKRTAGEKYDNPAQ